MNKIKNNRKKNSLEKNDNVNDDEDNEDNEDNVNDNALVDNSTENKKKKTRKKKIVKIIYLYRDSHLPCNGWLQSCFNCYTITSKTITFKTIHNKGYFKKRFVYEYDYWEFKVFLCGKCRRKLEDKKDCKNIKEYTKFNSTCNRYIKNHYNYLFTS